MKKIVIMVSVMGDKRLKVPNPGSAFFISKKDAAAMQEGTLEMYLVGDKADLHWPQLNKLMAYLRRKEESYLFMPISHEILVQCGSMPFKMLERFGATVDLSSVANLAGRRKATVMSLDDIIYFGRLRMARDEEQYYSFHMSLLRSINKTYHGMLAFPFERFMLGSA